MQQLKQAPTARPKVAAGLDARRAALPLARGASRSNAVAAASAAAVAAVAATAPAVVQLDLRAAALAVAVVAVVQLDLRAAVLVVAVAVVVQLDLRAAALVVAAAVDSKAPRVVHPAVVEVAAAEAAVLRAVDKNRFKIPHCPLWTLWDFFGFHLIPAISVSH
jgi:hypothetical protein